MSEKIKDIEKRLKNTPFELIHSVCMEYASDERESVKKLVLKAEKRPDDDLRKEVCGSGDHSRHR